jgi:ferrous iron transport protein A
MQRLEGGAGAALRLEGLGLRPGVRIIKKAGLLSRGPVVITIGNAEIAIGHGIAAKIIVREVTTGTQ